MKFLSVLILITLAFSGCQDSRYIKQQKPVMINGYHVGVNPNSMANKAQDKSKDRQNKLEISKIDSNTKIEIAKIKSNNQLQIAKVQAIAKTDVAKTDSTTKIQTTKIEATTKKDDLQNSLYITIAVVVLVIFALFLLYLNNKKSRDLKVKLQKDQLFHDRLLKEREYEEQRLHKMLQLVGNGKLSPEMEEKLIISLTKPREDLTLIESK